MIVNRHTKSGNSATQGVIERYAGKVDVDGRNSGHCLSLRCVWIRVIVPLKKLMPNTTKIEVGLCGILKETGLGVERIAGAAKRRKVEVRDVLMRGTHMQQRTCRKATVED